MKAVTTKMIVSLAGVLLIAPFLVVALLVGARAVALSQGTQDDLLLVALVLGGAAASIINGMGRHAASGIKVDGERDEQAISGRSRRHSMIHLGY